MNYTGIDCPSCGKKFEQTDDVVVCPVCGTPQHRDCWNENGKCINEEKHSEGFIWQMQDNEPEKPAHAHSEDMKICPRCGEHNEKYEPVCTKCGERLKANRQTIDDQMPPFGNMTMPFGNRQQGPNPNNFSPYQNVYAADARIVFGADAKIDDIPVTEIAEYIQKDSNKYIGKFLDMQEKNSKLSWNWSAGILSAFWCFYRKMVGLGVALIAIFFSVTLISSIVPATVYRTYKPEVYTEYEMLVEEINEIMQQVSKNGTATMEDASRYYTLTAKLIASPINVTSLIIRAAAVILMCIIMGFFGNSFYKKKIIKDIGTIRRLSGDSTTYHYYLHQKGNVSVVNILLPILLYTFFSTLTTYF